MSSPQDHERRLARRPKAVSGQVEDYDPPDDDLDPDGPSEADLARFSDVTITCPECGTELLDEVSVCWKCGRVLDSSGRGKIPLWAILTVVVIVVGFVLFGMRLF